MSRASAWRMIEPSLLKAILYPRLRTSDGFNTDNSFSNPFNFAFVTENDDPWKDPFDAPGFLTFSAVNQ